MYYYNIISTKRYSLSDIKKKIRNNSIISGCHCIVFLFVIIYSNPWPNDFRDYGFYILLYFMVYLIITNSLNCIFLFDEYVINTSENKEYGQLFNPCKTLRHIVFWIYGLYVQLSIIFIGIEKLKTAITFELHDYYIPRTCFLIWSVISLYIDTYWLMKTCIYTQLINKQNENFNNDSSNL